jgi:hypothetical protein
MLWRRNNRRENWRQVGRRVLGVCGTVIEVCGWICEVVVHLVALCLPWTATSREWRRAKKRAEAEKQYIDGMWSAVRADDVEMIRRLRKSDRDETSWMCYAAYWGSPSVLRFLAAQGVNPNCETECGLDCPARLPLMEAVYGAAREAERLAEDPALLARRLETISALIGLGANVNVRPHLSDRLPLRFAVDSGLPREIADLLLDAGARVLTPEDGARGWATPALTSEEARRELELYEGQGGPSASAEALRRAAETGRVVIVYRARPEEPSEGEAYYAVSDDFKGLPVERIEWSEWARPDGKIWGSPAHLFEPRAAERPETPPGSGP